MKIVGCDIETTGFSAAKGDRIVEFAAQIWDYDSRTLLKTVVQRINPLRSMPDNAFKVHGISLEVLKDKPTWEQFSPVVQKILHIADVVVCHNFSFDGPFIGEEQLRVGIVPPDVQGYCTMKNARWACADGKLPKLGELCWALGVPYDKDVAHAADYDVDRMMECLWKGVDAGRFTLPTKC